MNAFPYDSFITTHVDPSVTFGFSITAIGVSPPTNVEYRVPLSQPLTSIITFLVDHYSTIYILDYRYSNVNVIDFVKEKQADDLICINNISLIGDEDVAATISGVLQ